MHGSFQIGLQQINHHRSLAAVQYSIAKFVHSPPTVATASNLDVIEEHYRSALYRRPV